MGIGKSSASGRRPSAAGGGWTGNKRQIEFRGKVLKAAIDVRIKRGRKRFPSLDEKQLAVVKDANGVKVKAEVAADASKFLAAAKSALKRTHEAAEKKLNSKKALTRIEKDALLTDDVKISGYRSVEKEKQLWIRYFSGYYNRTAKVRSQTGDPHGAKAIRLMVRFITTKKAPPGFSKHTRGVSIDFYQKRYASFGDIMAVGANPKWIKNSTKKGKAPGYNEWWYQTWLYSWLHKNAAHYGFTELASEAWHYDFVGTSTKKKA